MTKVDASRWTPDKLAAMSKNELQNLLANAARLGEDELAQLCTQELSRRTPTRSERPKSLTRSVSGDFVSEYHFVCERDLVVRTAPGGCFWSGSWVVSEENVKKSLKYGAHLALHESKVEPSYRRGAIIEYRKAARDIIDKTNEGIEFLVRSTDEPLEWVGAGTGEKGYRWEPLRRQPSDLSEETSMS